MKHSQRGYSLIELSIVLAIIAVVIGGAITGVQAILQSNNVNKLISNTNRAVGAITAKLIRDANYANATTANLSSTAMGIWEPRSVTNAGANNATVTHDFGSAVFVTPIAAAAFGLGANQAYVYSLTGIPTSACTDVVMGLESLALAVSVVNQAVPNAAPNALAAGAALVKSPPALLPNSATVAAQCAPAVDSGQTTISLLIPRS
jgi:prepilin-type N-terminal cleavage/methylation domain-containing protein